MYYSLPTWVFSIQIFQLSLPHPLNLSGECQNLSINSEYKPLIDQDNHFYTQINLHYYDILEFNQINHNMESSFNLIHTNLASIYKHHDNLQQCLKINDINKCI